MKISIIVGGRFHAFDLAQQLNNHGCLNQLITPILKILYKKTMPSTKIKLKVFY